MDLAIIKDAEYAEDLRNQGINAVGFKYRNKDELYTAINMLGDIFGEDAQAYATKWENKLDETIAKISDDLSDVPESERCNVYYVDATGAEASNKLLYSNFASLLKYSCPELFVNYQKQLHSSDTISLLPAPLLDDKALSPKTTEYKSTAMYTSSRRIKAMQFLNQKILRTWVDVPNHKPRQLPKTQD